MRRAGLLIFVGIMGSAALAMCGGASAGDGGAPDPAAHKRPSVSRSVARRVERLEAANRALEGQNRMIQGQISAQTAEINRLKQALEASVRPVPALQRDLPKVEAKMAVLEKKQAEWRPTAVQVGFLTGWSEQPYDMPGGFFWGAYLRDGLLTEEDGVPGGTVSGELMAGIVMGSHVLTSGNLASALTAGHPPFESWMNTIEIQPTAQYHLDMTAVGLPSWENFKPYVLAGPAIWISQMSTPVVNGPVPGGRYRHYDASTQAGGVYGGGFQLSLAGLKCPAIQGILNKTSVGAEWRYNELANGEQFQQYMGSIALGF